MDDRYFWKKNLITSGALIFLAIIQLILNIGVRYYWNPVQGKISGIKDFTEAGGDASSLGYFLCFVLLFLPVVALVFFTREAGEKRFLRFILAPTCIVYIVSAIILFQQMPAFKHLLEDPYELVDKIVYVPMFFQAVLMALYLLGVLIKPDLLVNKIIAIITVFVSILFFIADAAFIAYLHLMDTLSGDFGLIMAGMFLACYVLDVVTFFLMLSALMTYCAMHREVLIEFRYDLKQQKREERWMEKQNSEPEDDSETPEKKKGFGARFRKKNKSGEDEQIDEALEDYDENEALESVESTEEAKEAEGVSFEEEIGELEEDNSAPDKESDTEVEVIGEESVADNVVVVKEDTSATEVEEVAKDVAGTEAQNTKEVAAVETDNPKAAVEEAKETAALEIENSDVTVEELKKDDGVPEASPPGEDSESGAQQGNARRSRRSRKNAKKP